MKKEEKPLEPKMPQPVKSEKKEEPKKVLPLNEEKTEKVPQAEALSKDELQKKGTVRLQKLKDLHQKYKSPAGIAELEKLPAFMRKGVTLDNPPHSSETEVSRYTLSEEDNGEGEKRTEIKPNNPYLHDNVD